MRLIDYVTRNFPRTLGNDAYALPGGEHIPIGPLFDWLVAGTAKVLGAGHPSAGLVETVAAFAPVALALITIVAVFAIGRRLFDPLAGVFAAALLATMPGPFLDRTVLGYVDHHAAEACFSTLTMLGLCWAVDRARLAGAFRQRDVAIRSALAGAALGAYLLSWTSGAFLVAILTVWIAAQYLLDQARGVPSGRLVECVLPAVGVAALMLLVLESGDVPQHGMRLVALGGAAAVIVSLDLVRRGVAYAGVGRGAFFGGALIAAFLGWVAFRFGAPGIYGSVLDNMGRLAPSAAAVTVGEARPLVSLSDWRSFIRAWLEFRTAIVLAVPAVVLLIRDVWRKPQEGRVLLVVWSMVAIAATMAQNRFGYYLAIELALLGGWITACVLRWAGADVGQATWRSRAAVVVVSAAVFYPNVTPAIGAAERDYGMPPVWHDAMQWMRTATPEPFGDPDAYFEPLTGRMTPTYSVMGWWDYGYWLMRDAHRVPLTNPTQLGAGAAGAFFSATDAVDAFAKLRGTGARYILTGEEMPMRNFEEPGHPWQRWFPAMALWADRPVAQYYEAFYQRSPDGTVAPTFMYYPDYFRSMAIRLYQYGGQATAQQSPTAVIQITPHNGVSGRTLMEVVEVQLFEHYADAVAYGKTRTSDHRIVCLDPKFSCVPLEAVPGQRIVYESPEQSSTLHVPAVRIFEVTP